MSMEQELSSLSEQVSLLTKAVMLAVEKLSVLPSGPVAPVVEKLAKSKKQTSHADAPVAATPVAPAATTDASAQGTKFTEIEGYLLDGDPAGTRYFVVESHNTAYKQRPGDPDCTLTGAVIVPGSVYLAKKDEFEKKFKLAQEAAKAPVQATPEPVTSAPTATASAEVVSMPATFESVINAMRALYKAQGNDGVQKVLVKYGVARIPMLNGVASNENLLADIEAVSLGI